MYEKIARHIGHNIEVASYGNPTYKPADTVFLTNDIVNVAVECMDCCEVIVDADYENIDDCGCDEQMRKYWEFVRD